jgi:hypothetical protein
VNINSQKFDRLHELALKLNALMAMTYGNARESFTCLSDELQDDYLWACGDMAREMKALLIEANMDALVPPSTVRRTEEKNHA